MRTLSDNQKRILTEEFPNISYDSDADVERYFELRQAGRQGDALALYNGKLRRKYPDEAQRTLLLRYYRSRDTRYRSLYLDSLAIFADRLIARTQRIIEILTRDINAIDQGDAWSVIKTVEGLLAVISPDRYAAIAFSERYVRYAKLLNFRHDEMERTSELIRLYVTDTLESVQEFKREKEAKKREHAKRQASQRVKPAFDLSKLTFSEADIAKILIPARLNRTEDVVIAYCLKYWNLAFDPAFEKTILLYSRKYHTKHNDIYQAIKNGREHNWKDEEILNAVLANVVSGYYYSISGDVYLQQAWARCKANYDLTTSEPTAPAATALAALTTAKTSARAPSKARPSTSGRRKAAIGKAGAARATANKAVSAQRIEPTKAQPKVFDKKPKDAPRKVAAFRQTPEPTQAFRPNSVADIIKKITGKTYTVYKELFFRGIRPSIRATLSSSLIGKNSLFGSRQNDAEEIVYHFLYDHFNDPYLNWVDSEERKGLEGLGYRVPEIEPIIRAWVQANPQG